MTLGEQLKDLREHRNMTQSELAIKLKMSHSSIAMWETSKRDPNTEMIIRIAEFFKVTIDFLLTGKNPPQFQTGTPYSRMLKQAVEKSGITMTEISERLTLKGHGIHASYIGKLINGTRDPASDETNTTLADLLGIDSLELRALAWLEKIPPDVLEKIKEIDK